MSDVRHRRERMPISAYLKGYLSIEEAAERLGLSYSQTWRYAVLGKLAAKNTPMGYAIRESSVKNFKPNPKGNPDFKTNKNPAIVKMKKSIAEIKKSRSRKRKPEE